MSGGVAASLLTAIASDSREILFCIEILFVLVYSKKQKWVFEGELYMDNSVIYNRIYALSLEWGQNWRKSVIKIVKEEYPSLSDKQQEQISNYIENTRAEIEHYVYDLYWSTNGIGSIAEKVSDWIQSNYSWMNHENISHATSQAIYYAIK